MYKAVIEMPFGTRYKYEIDKKTKTLTLDRPVDEMVVANYGYILNTKAEDGDPLDVFVVATEPLFPLVRVKIEIVGIIKCKDNGVQDDKVLAYIKDDEEAKQSMGFEEFARKCIWYLESYKKGLIVEEVLDKKAAIAQIKKVSVS